MRRYLPLLASLAIVIGVGLVVLGWNGNHEGSRDYPWWEDDAHYLMTVGAMLITAGALGLWRPRSK